MFNAYETYFLQCQDWAKFWQEANGVGHIFLWFHTKVNDKYTLSTLVYQYPWHFGQSFWYIPKGGVLTNKNDTNYSVNSFSSWQDIEQSELQYLFCDLNKQIYDSAKAQKISYIKVDWEEGLTQRLGLKTNKDLEHFYQNNFKNTKNYKNFQLAKISSKTIQYLSTITLDLSTISPVEDLEQFFIDSKSFWKTTNSNVNRYTKKSLELSIALNWDISTQKTESNFELFWQVYNQTKDRQHFTIQPKAYMRHFFDQDFSRIIVIKDQDNQPQCVWMGIVFGDTITYLYGGNTDYSFDNYCQYLTHLVAIKMAVSEKLLKYDLGGYDPNKGFGKFKSNYKGTIRNFLGDIDIPIHLIKYTITNNTIKLIKFIKRQLTKKR